jgi:hypothetical protein
MEHQSLLDVFLCDMNSKEKGNIFEEEVDENGRS